MYAPLPQPHQTRKLSPSTTILPDAISTGDDTSLCRWEKGSLPKKTHHPPHISLGLTQQCRQRHKLLRTPSPATPTMRYQKQSSITWLLLRSRFSSHTLASLQTQLLTSYPTFPSLNNLSHHRYHNKPPMKTQFPTTSVTSQVALNVTFLISILLTNNSVTRLIPLTVTQMRMNQHNTHQIHLSIYLPPSQTNLMMRYMGLTCWIFFLPKPSPT